mmetsp:Transcript_4400/g.13929  ORF Transcript_4400/g.13929 Transcript_4400/m.13929 type:complete len:226 (-) Transcript_4400:218-895(-)
MARSARTRTLAHHCRENAPGGRRRRSSPCSNGVHGGCAARARPGNGRLCQRTTFSHRSTTRGPSAAARTAAATARWRRARPKTARSRCSPQTPPRQRCCPRQSPASAASQVAQEVSWPAEGRAPGRATALREPPVVAAIGTACASRLCSLSNRRAVCRCPPGHRHRRTAGRTPRERPLRLAELSHRWQRHRRSRRWRQRWRQRLSRWRWAGKGRGAAVAPSPGPS